MTHSVIWRAVSVVAATTAAGWIGCGTRTVPGSAPRQAEAIDAAPATPGDSPMQKVAIIELQIDGGQLWVSITNEVGATDLVDVGTFPGECAAGADTAADPQTLSGAVFAVDCHSAGGGGVRLRFMHREGDLIVMRAPEAGGGFEVFTRVALPRDARIRFEQ